MFIDRNTASYCINENVTIRGALEALNASKRKTVFTVDNYFRLRGALTDGDFRRWVIQQSQVDLSLPVGRIANTKLTRAYDDESAARLAEKLSNKIAYLPIVDRDEHVVGVASFQNHGLTLGKHSLNDDARVLTIAEIGNNHNGSLERARALVDAAAEVGADCVKFQLRDLDALYGRAKSQGDDASEDLGSQYVLSLLRRFQLADDDYWRIFDHARARGLTVLCTPFDLVSVDKLAAYGMEGYKIASADLTNHEMLAYVARLGKPLLVSTGMSTEQEIYDAVKRLKAEGAGFALLHCNSTYPAPFKDINLNYMSRLKEIGDCLLGYSGHERGYHVAVAAVAKGAKIIEKHFTLDRTLEGNDHKVSLLPHEFRAMIEAIREVEQSLGSNKPRNLSQGELMNRETLGKSLVAAVDIAEGQRITPELLLIKSPGKGLPPSRRDDLVGRVSPRALKAGEFFYESDISGQTYAPRAYRFRLAHGIPVRFHDVRALAERSNLRLVEFHLSYRDLDLDPFAFLTEPLALGFAVHAPELFAGDHTLDLCSPDPDYRARSVAALQRVIALTRTLKARFPSTPRPLIVVNVGGFSDRDFLAPGEREQLGARLGESLAALDREGVELVAQTMPPFPWHFGGQRYHNLFVTADDITRLARALSLRICLDVSHSFLSCNYFQRDFHDFVEQVAPLAAHLHLGDARGVDGEGMQVGEGEIDFQALGKQLVRLCPEASWVPEVWQGHKNEGEGFWRAFARLEGLL